MGSPSAPDFCAGWRRLTPVGRSSCRAPGCDLRRQMTNWVSTGHCPGCCKCHEHGHVPPQRSSATIAAFWNPQGPPRSAGRIQAARIVLGVTRRWQRRGRGSRPTRAAKMARSASRCAVVGWCDGVLRPHAAARGARPPWSRTFGPLARASGAGGGRSGTAGAATRRRSSRGAGGQQSPLVSDICSILEPHRAARPRSGGRAGDDAVAEWRHGSSMGCTCVKRASVGTEGRSRRSSLHLDLRNRRFWRQPSKRSPATHEHSMVIVDQVSGQ